MLDLQMQTVRVNFECTYYNLFQCRDIYNNHDNAFRLGFIDQTSQP